jgi:hypothetical protein
MFTYACILQAIITYSAAIIDVGIEATGYYLILLACGYLKSIQCRLISLAERQNKIKLNDNEYEKIEIELIHNDIISCIKYHQHIMA